MDSSNSFNRLDDNNIYNQFIHGELDLEEDKVVVPTGPKTQLKLPVALFFKSLTEEFNRRSEGCSVAEIEKLKARTLALKEKISDSIAKNGADIRREFKESQARLLPHLDAELAQTADEREKELEKGMEAKLKALKIKSSNPFSKLFKKGSKKSAPIGPSKRAQNFSQMEKELEKGSKNLMQAVKKQEDKLFPEKIREKEAQYEKKYQEYLATIREDRAFLKKETKRSHFFASQYSQIFQEEPTVTFIVGQGLSQSPLKVSLHASLLKEIPFFDYLLEKEESIDCQTLPFSEAHVLKAIQYLYEKKIDKGAQLTEDSPLSMVALLLAADYLGINSSCLNLIDQDLQEVLQSHVSSLLGKSDIEAYLDQLVARNGKLSKETAATLELLAEKGHSKAALLLGRTLLNQQGIILERATAWQYVQMAAQAGNPEACYLKAVYLKLTKAKNKADVQQEIFAGFEQAVKGGYTPALVKLGECYALGKGTKQDSETAKSYYEQALEKEDFSAYNYLGFLLLDKRHRRPHDIRQAAKYFEKALEHFEKGDNEYLKARHALKTCKDLTVDHKQVISLEQYLNG